MLACLPKSWYCRCCSTKPHGFGPQVDGGGEFVSPSVLDETRVLRDDLLDERMGLLDLIAYQSLRSGNVATFAQWVCVVVCLSLTEP